MITDKYSYCEPIGASSVSKWHIRELDAAGLKPGGGATTPALCGRPMAWDIPMVETNYPKPDSDFICPECLRLFRDAAGATRGTTGRT